MRPPRRHGGGGGRGEGEGKRREGGRGGRGESRSGEREEGLKIWKGELVMPKEKPSCYCLARVASAHTRASCSGGQEGVETRWLLVNASAVL